MMVNSEQEIKLIRLIEEEIVPNFNPDGIFGIKAVKSEDVPKIDLTEISQKDEYFWQLRSNPKRKIGFENKEKGFHVCYPMQDTFILYDPQVKEDQKYFGYGPGFGIPPMRIGIKIEEKDKQITIHRPVMINKAAHPSICCFDKWEKSQDYHDYDYSCIDLGYYDLRRSVREQSVGRNIIHILSAAINVLKDYPCSDYEWAPFFRCFEGYKKQDGVYVKLLTKEQAESSGAPITNLDMLAMAGHIKR